MQVKGHHPLAELLLKKLFMIESVPEDEQRRMVQRAVKAAVEWHEQVVSEYKEMIQILEIEIKMDEIK